MLVSYLKMHEIFNDIIGKRLKEREIDNMKRYGDFLDVLLDQCELKDDSFSLTTIKSHDDLGVVT